MKASIRSTSRLHGRRIATLEVSASAFTTYLQWWQSSCFTYCTEIVYFATFPRYNFVNIVNVIIWNILNARHIFDYLFCKLFRISFFYVKTSLAGLLNEKNVLKKRFDHFKVVAGTSVQWSLPVNFFVFLLLMQIYFTSQFYV